MGGYFTWHKNFTKYSNTTNGLQGTEDRMKSLTEGSQIEKKSGLVVRFLWKEWLKGKTQLRKGLNIVIVV